MHSLDTIKRLNAEAVERHRVKDTEAENLEALKDELWACGAEAFDKWDELHEAEGRRRARVRSRRWLERRS